jgi:hypothetical protein
VAFLASSSTQDTLAPPHRRFAKASIAAAGSTPTTRQSGFLASAAASTPVPQPRSSIARRRFAKSLQKSKSSAQPF